MKASMISSIALAALVAAAPSRPARRQNTLTAAAILQFEIAPDTFTSNTEITIGTVLDTDLEVLSMSIGSTDGVANPRAVICEAREQSTLLGTFTQLRTLRFPALQTVTSISCSGGGSIPPSATPASTPAASSTRVAAPVATPSRAAAAAPAAPAAGANAILQFEIAPNTFTSNFVAALGTQIDTNLNIISASIARVEGARNANNVVCTATENNSSRVAGTFTLLRRAIFGQGAPVRITSISCVEN